MSSAPSRAEPRRLMIAGSTRMQSILDDERKTRQMLLALQLVVLLLMVLAAMLSVTEHSMWAIPLSWVITFNAVVIGKILVSPQYSGERQLSFWAKLREVPIFTASFAFPVIALIAIFMR